MRKRYNILGLKGFSSLGTVEPYFEKGAGFFPRKLNWTPADLGRVRDGYTKFVEQGKAENANFPEEYILVSYSDGGTIAHDLFLSDPRCVGLVAHSSVFVGSRALRSLLAASLPARPVLLIANSGDKTGMWATTKTALKFYKEQRFPTEYQQLMSGTWHKHEFSTGLLCMASWGTRNFGFRIPVLVDKAT